MEGGQQPPQAAAHPGVAYFPVGVAPNNGSALPNRPVNRNHDSAISRGFGCFRLVMFSFVGLMLLITVFIYAGVSRSFYTTELDNVPSVSSTVSHGKLPNGLKYSILANPIKRDRVTLYLRVQAGSVNEDDDQLGIAHFIEHMAFDSTVDYPTRGGTWDQLMKLGALFNAFTSFRTTVYELWDLPTTSIEQGLAAHQAQVLHIKLVQGNMDQEKGAVLGEARFRNGSDNVQITEMLTNHFGSNYRITNRFPIGDPANMVYSVESAQKFITNWYRVDRMNLYVTGDITPSKAEEAIKKVWGPVKLSPNQPPKPPQQPSIGTPKPKDALLLKQVDGINGFSAYFLLSDEYQGYPKTENDYRQQFLDMIFSFFYTIQVVSRYSAMYPDMPVDEILSNRLAGVGVMDEFSLGTKLHLFAASISGDSQSGTWKRDMEVAFSELRRLAILGPNKQMLLGLMYELQFMLYAEEAYSRGDSIQMINGLLGDLDPSFTYLDSEQMRNLATQYLSFGFLQSAAYHIQAEAQYLWNSLAFTLYPDMAIAFPYVDRKPGSFSVFTGRTDSKFTTVSEESIRAVFKKVSNDQVPVSDFPESSFSMGSGGEDSIPASGGLFDMKKVIAGQSSPPVLVEDNQNSGVRRYKLSNGVMVNLKVSRSGKNHLPNGPKGPLQMEIVALGGLASQSPDIASACYLVNTGSESGSRVYYSSTDYQDYDINTVRQFLQLHPGNGQLFCDEEHMVIQSNLFGMCPNYPEETTCFSPSDGYMNSLQASRLAMFPRYDTESIKKAVNFKSAEEKYYKTTQDPLEVLELDARDWLFKEAFPDDPRLHNPTASDIEELDPLAVSQWVAQHFSVPSNIEINIVGDCAGEGNLISQLNTIFGTMKQISFPTKIGFNPYAANDISHFSRKFPEKTITYNCSIPSVTPDRAYAVLLAPSTGMLHFRQNEINLIGRSVLSMQAFKMMRQDNGYGYFAMTSAKHSVLFPDWGYFEMNWAPGPYGCPNKKCQTYPTNDRLHINSSSSTAQETFQTPFSEDLFHSVMAQTKSQLAAKLQYTQAWLQALRGLSLPPPANWPSDIKTVKSMSSADPLEVLQRMTYESVKDYASKTTKGAPVLFSSIATVEQDKSGLWGRCGV